MNDLEKKIMRYLEAMRPLIEKCGELKEENSALRKEVETVREVSGNRLQLWMDVCKERAALRKLCEEMAEALEEVKGCFDDFDQYEDDAERIIKEVLARYAAAREAK